MKNIHRFVAKTMAPVHDTENAIYLGKGVTIPLSLASRPMILALRKKYWQKRETIRISKRSKRFLFTFSGFTSCDETYY